MIKSFKTILISALVSLWSLSGVAQQIYQTKEGSIGVIGLYRDTKIIANSNQLFALINYETAEIELTLNPATLRTTTDSLNLKLINSSIGPVILKGKLNIPYVNTLDHPTHKLNFEAELHLNGVVKAMYINGELKHIASNGAISCLLTLNFKLGLNDFGIILPEGWNNEVTIQISQAVLKRSNQ
jgi:hypothetical protein